jgi:signal transduction histidine kinase
MFTLTVSTMVQRLVRSGPVSVSDVCQLEGLSGFRLLGARLIATLPAQRPRRGSEMREASGAQVQPRRSARFTRGDDELNGTGEDERSPLVEREGFDIERERAAIELYAKMTAHELMAPLIAADTHARLLEKQLQDRVDGSARGELRGLIRRLSGMRLLVETLLLEARSFGEPLERTPVSVRQLVDEAVELLETEIRARDARIVVAQLPVVRGDRVLLGSVVNNLLQNALRYGPRSAGEVRIEARHERAYWRISITSRGSTIPPNDSARIFEPYSRGTDERRGAGAGLGLTICRSIVERHGGVIGVTPCPEGGNRFYFTITD